MNQWPTIFFTLKDIDGLNFDEAYGQLAAQISNLFKEYTYLLDSENVDIDDKKTKVRNEELEKTLPENILALQIPNAEIREIFETTVIMWFDDSAKIWNRSVMRLCSRLIKKCMQKNLKMNMTVFCVMESHFSKNDVVSE